MKTITKCKTCGKEIQKWPSQRKAGEGKYCSKACYVEAMKGVDLFAGKVRARRPKIRVKMNCEHCSKEFETVPSKIGSRKYCCQTCRREHCKSTITNLRQLRQSKEYRKWRLIILARDNFTCQGCSEVGGILHVHHIVPVVVDVKRIFDLTNGVTLCEECHIMVHENYKPKSKRSELLETLLVQETISSQANRERLEGSTTNAYVPDRNMKRHERSALNLN